MARRRRKRVSGIAVVAIAALACVVAAAVVLLLVRRGAVWSPQLDPQEAARQALSRGDLELALEKSADVLEDGQSSPQAKKLALDVSAAAGELLDVRRLWQTEKRFATAHGMLAQIASRQSEPAGSGSAGSTPLGLTAMLDAESKAVAAEQDAAATSLIQQGTKKLAEGDVKGALPDWRAAMGPELGGASPRRREEISQKLDQGIAAQHLKCIEAAGSGHLQDALAGLDKLSVLVHDGQDLLVEPARWQSKIDDAKKQVVLEQNLLRQADAAARANDPSAAKKLLARASDVKYSKDAWATAAARLEKLAPGASAGIAGKQPEKAPTPAPRPAETVARKPAEKPPAPEPRPADVAAASKPGARTSEPAAKPVQNPVSGAPKPDVKDTVFDPPALAPLELEQIAQTAFEGDERTGTLPAEKSLAAQAPPAAATGQDELSADELQALVTQEAAPRTDSQQQAPAPPPATVAPPLPEPKPVSAAAGTSPQPPPEPTSVPAVTEPVKPSIPAPVEASNPLDSPVVATSPSNTTPASVSKPAQSTSAATTAQAPPAPRTQTNPGSDVPATRARNPAASGSSRARPPAAARAPGAADIVVSAKSEKQRQDAELGRQFYLKGRELEQQAEARADERYYRYALEAYDKVPENAERMVYVRAHARAGRILSYRLKDYAQAVPHYERAVQKDPRHPVLHYEIGYAAFHLGRFDEAIKAFSRVGIYAGVNPDEVQDYPKLELQMFYLNALAHEARAGRNEGDALLVRDAISAWQSYLDSCRLTPKNCDNKRQTQGTTHIERLRSWLKRSVAAEFSDTPG